LAERNFWMRWRVRTGYPVGLLYWLLASPTPRSISIGTVVALVGLAIRAAAAGHLRKDRELATSGPYAHTRNPLYLGSAFLALGFGVAGNSLWAGVLVLMYFGVFYYAVMRNEEAGLRDLFGPAYAAYAAHVPLFFPRLTAWHANGAGSDTTAFSGAQYKRNREYKALIGTLLGIGVVWLRMFLRARFGY
jgi:protein-S-isoprenylcysteine O-methyltransferase Ste14